MTASQSHILIVDDEPFFRNLYADLLRQDHYVLTLCDSGEEAIQLLGKKSFDLVLTDMVMPGKDGLDILRVARAASDPADVILVTGHASLESAVDALRSGARDYLVKPFDPVELQHIVCNSLEQRKLLAENDKLRRQVQLFLGAQSLSSLLEFDALLPQAMAILMRQMVASIGIAYTCSSEEEITLFVNEGLSEPEVNRIKPLLRLKCAETSHSCDSAAGDLFRLKKVDFDSQEFRSLSFCDENDLTVMMLLGGIEDESSIELNSPDLRYLCDQVLLGIQNASRYQKAQQLMYTDDLTGLYNHRYMQVALSQEMKRSQRYGLMFSLLFLDLDHFKNINDTHGHLAGSAALKEVGGLLRASVRSVDTLFRYGGDEFAVLLVEADADGARRVAERIRKAIEEHTFLDDEGTPSFMTVTAGFATFPIDAKDYKQLLHLADKAMYAGKQTRNITRGLADLS